MAIEERAGMIRAGTLGELAEKGCLVVSGDRHGVAVFWHEGEVFAVDNRCPHMGFPLNKGSLHCGILTCHWHHARFDLRSGGTFDPFADDVRVYQTEVRDGEVWIDLRSGGGDRVARSLARLRDGMEQGLSLVTIKSVLALLDQDVAARHILAVGADYGARYRDAGWGPGLTILTALGNIFPALADDERPLALSHGLIRVAEDCAGQPPRFDLDPLPTQEVSLDRLKTWLRQFVEVRDGDGAERVVRTAIANGYSPAEISDLLLAAATDHYFLNGGHTVDFLNKAEELLDQIGWDQAATVLPSLTGGLARAQRSEESNAWRHPIDLVALVEAVVPRLPALAGIPVDAHWSGFDALVETLLGEDPAASVTALTSALEAGAGAFQVSQAVSYAAALRVARFHTSNEFGDWITVLHTLSYANALQASLRRSVLPASGHASPEALRGVFHGALRVYLDRFLNMPAARLPDDRDIGQPASADALLDEFQALFERQQEVNPAGALAYRYLAQGHPAERLIAVLGRVLLREDAEFHSYQMLEAGVQQYRLLRETRPRAAAYALVGVARYLAAHSPTSRALLQTARIAQRLHRGEDLTDGE